MLASMPSNTSHFVSTGASGSGDGSLATPWTMAQISASTPPASIANGDTIYLRGGTYTAPAMDTGLRNILNWKFGGVSGAPVTIKGYPGERAIISDSNDVVALAITAQAIIQVDHQWVNVEDIEITATYTTYLASGSQRRTPGIKSNQPNVNLRRLVVHDTGINILMGGTTVPGEIHGCISYFSGAASTEHCIYAESNVSGQTRIVRKNICFWAAGYGMHFYDSNPEHDLTADRNIVFNSGTAPAGAVANDWRPNVLFQTDSTTIMDGTHFGVLNPTLTNNRTYFTNVPAKSAGDNTVRVGKQSVTNGTINAVVTGNYLVNMDTRASATAIEANTPFNPTINTNTLIGNRPSGFDAAYPTNTVFAPGTPPTANQVFVEQDEYVPGRGYIAIYNWHNDASVSVDLSSILRVGAIYSIRNAQTYLGTPVVSSATYDGNPVSLSMAAVTIPAPVVTPANTIPSTGTQFHAFVVLPS